MAGNARRDDPYKKFNFRTNFDGIADHGDLTSKAVTKPPAKYPVSARASGASGTVTVAILVDENGAVLEARSLDGHPSLRRAATTAARQARFAPTKLSGQPVKVTGVIQYNFVAQ